MRRSVLFSGLVRAAAALSFCVGPAYGASATTVFEETFASLSTYTSQAATSYFVEGTEGTIGSVTISKKTYTLDNADWSGAWIAPGPGSIRFGKAKDAQGYAITPTISTVGGATVPVVKVSIWAASHASAANLALAVSLVLADGSEVSGTSFTTKKFDSTSDSMSSAFAVDNSGVTMACEFQNVASGFKVKFSSAQTDSRVFLGRVVVEQVDDSGPSALPAPTGLAAASVTETGFSLSWNAVSGAAGYALEVLDGAGAPAGTATVSGTGATVTGLASDTAYTAKVKALAPSDSTDNEDSAWSDPITVTTAIGDGLLRATLLDEGFSGSGNAWGNTSAKPDDAETDCDSWSFPANVYNARSSIKVGGAGAVGWALSPEITLSNEVASATVALSFSAAAYPEKTTKFSVSVVHAATGETNAIPALTALSPATLSSTSATDLSGCSDYEESVVVPTRFKLLFETINEAADKRLLLDSIQVTQVYDPNFAALAAPTGVAGSDVGKHGFTVSWTGVANATGYEVWLNGAVAGSCASADTSMPLAGLSDGTAYSVQVRALGDNLHFGDSPLSTAISVTTPADAQKIGFTVTGAPAGDVFAGDTVAFTVTAENEATHAAAEVSFSGIAGATFTAATGAFSWTPAESDVGSNVATFTSGDYSTNVTITVVSALKTETLFHETFAKCEKKWIGTSTEMTDAMADEANWTFSEHCYSGKSGLRIGLKEAPNYGLAMTRLIEPKKAGTISLSFRAAGNVAGSTMTVTSAGGATFSQTVTLAAFSSDDAPIPDEAGYVFGPYDIVVTGGFSLSFTPASGDGRMGVDEILVTQKISARIPDLPAPAGLALAGEPGEHGFSLSWDAVTGATNYAVRVTDASGAVVFSAPFCAAAQATVTGLADDEAYAVQVRATSDEALWFASPWSAAVNIRTARSAAHATLSFGPWINAAGDGLLYAGITNAAATSAVRDNGTNAVVTFTGVSPEPTVGPEFENGVLAWTPDDADTNKTFTVSFLLDGTYATNLSFKVRSVPFLQAPEAEAVDVAWNSFGLSWNRQLRAAGYAVRAWTDCPNPNATATRIEEDFAGYAAGVRPADWVFHCATGSSGFYKDDKAPVKLSESTHDLETYDLGGAISSVSFHAAGHSISNSTSTLTVVGIAADNTETVLATLSYSDIGQTGAGIDRTLSIPAGTDVRRIAWRYTKDKGGIGVGSVVIEGTGFATPRWLPGWGPAAKDVGLAQVCTVKKPRPGKALGPNPANKKEDLFEPRVNYAEVAARDAAGATRATVVAVEVPAPPRSVRATMLIAR